MNPVNDGSTLSGEVTRLLETAQHQGGTDALYARLIELTYPQLKEISRRQLSQGQRPALLQTTGLVHDAFLKLLGGAQVQIQSRAHFFALMARVMRQIIVDMARRGQTEARYRLELAQPPMQGSAGGPGSFPQVLELERALERLAGIDERMVQVIECRFFCGFNEEQTADALELSLRTAQRTWTRARAWLQREMAVG